MGMATETVVECYSGHTYAQEPRAFWLGTSRSTDGGMEYRPRQERGVEYRQRRTVIVVRRRWREPTGPCFDVLADDGLGYVLAYVEAADRWSVLAKADDKGFSSPAKNAGWSTECSDLDELRTHKEAGQG
jgi:hypothetical protein